jgi:hypothetical protein
MDDERRREINRENAKKSTGPRTPAGKARSSMNAVRHGVLAKRLILPGENALDFAGLRQGMREHFRPRDEVEEGLVERMVGATWRQRRAEAVELGLWDWRGHVSQGKTTLAEVFFMDSQNDESLQKLMRYMSACDREFYRALKTLGEIRTERRAREDEETDWIDDESEGDVKNDEEVPPDDNGHAQDAGGDGEARDGELSGQPASSSTSGQLGAPDHEAEMTSGEQVGGRSGSPTSGSGEAASRADDVRVRRTRWDDLTPEEQDLFVVRNHRQILDLDQLVLESMVNPYRVERLGWSKQLRLATGLNDLVYQTVTRIGHLVGTGGTESGASGRKPKGH